MITLAAPAERAVLVGAPLKRSVERHRVEEHLAELGQLADTAGAVVVGQVTQRLERPNAATYLGKGKIEELRALIEADGASVIIFDDELTPAQGKNIEEATGRRVIDRAELILDIFATRARTSEAKLQVELAQLEYMLPRLTRMWAHLERVRGGIGMRGPGETQLEVDRRRIQRRITKLEQDLKRLGRTRATQRKARRRRGLPAVALVGYTNAGKSTLLNRITDAEVRVEDRLFSTLDPTTRRLRLTGGETVLCSDTVGFVRRLPHELVEAFRSTLEMVTEADLILHVVDGAAPDAPAQIAAVHTVLDEIEATDVPELLIVNKVDIAEPARVRELCQGETALAVSAATGEGVDKLLSAVGDRLRALATVVELLVPYERGDVLAGLHRDGEVLVEVHVDAGTRVRARIDGAALSRYREFVTG